MGLFDNKTKDEKEREKNIKKILGGFAWSTEVGVLFRKYNRGMVKEQEAWNRTKKEAKEGKIEPEQYLARLEQLLSEIPPKEEQKKIKEEQKQKEKLLFDDEMSTEVLKQKINQDQINMAIQEVGTGWANLANTMSFNSYQQLMSRTQKAIIDQNKSLIRQIELQQRTLDEQQLTLNEILKVLKNKKKEL